MNNNKETKSTESESFGRELETSELSVFDKDFEKEFYERQYEIVNLYRVDPKEALKLRKELRDDVKVKMEDERDNDFKRFSTFAELLDFDDYKEVLQDLKKELYKNGFENFLLEYHIAKDINDNHIQYTGNKSSHAKTFIQEYVTRKELSVKYISSFKEVVKVKKNKTTMNKVINKLNDDYKVLDQLMNNVKNNIKNIDTKNTKDTNIDYVDNKLSATNKENIQDVINRAKAYEKQIKEQKQVFVQKVQQLKEHRRF